MCIRDRIKEYSVPKELTAPLLNAMIEKILIHEATTNEENERIQEIAVSYTHLDVYKRQDSLCIELISSV